MRLITVKSDYTDHWAIKHCMAAAQQSTCHRRRCGSIISAADNGNILGVGWNSQPGGITCSTCIKDSLPADFKSDKTCCVHAEQRAILHALKSNSHRIVGSRLFFAIIDEKGYLEYAGKPYCTICSKMALDVGIAEFVLVQKEGITVYTTKEYNKLSFQYSGG